MAEGSGRSSRRDALPIGALIGSVIEPVCAKRGFASGDLIAAWSDIVGPRYAHTTSPEKILWPRRDSRASVAATLVVRVDAGMAIYLQHETALVLEKVNAFLGFGAIGAIRIVQGPVEAARTAPAVPAPGLSPAAEATLERSVGEIESEGLRDALRRLGRGVYGEVERT